MKPLIQLFLLITFLCADTACTPDGNKNKNDRIGNAAPGNNKSQIQDTPVILPKPYATPSAVNFSEVLGWPQGKTPVAPQGFTVQLFARELGSPRNIYVAGNGDIFVALANSNPKGIKKVARKVTSQPASGSPDQIILFRDENHDGKPEVQQVFLDGQVSQPFGMLILGNSFYVAGNDGIWKFPYETGQLKITGPGVKILDLPKGGRHWTRNLIAGKDGKKIYVAVGSGSDHGEKGIAYENRRACILEINPDGSGERVFASGLRNPVGLSWSPESGELWTAVNERDMLGDELVPDFITSVKEGGFYGWPYSYFGKNPDPRIKGSSQRPDLVSKAIVPDVPMGAHTACLGIAFYKQGIFPEKFHNGAFVCQHGSWNHSALVGYKIVFVPFRNGKPAGPPEDFATGFIADKAKSKVYGRPVGVAILPDGSLLFSDDGAGVLFRVSYKK